MLVGLGNKVHYYLATTPEVVRYKLIHAIKNWTVGRPKNKARQKVKIG